MSAKNKEYADFTSRRRTSAELPAFFPELAILNGIPDQELEQKWTDIYRRIFMQADSYRSIGNHRNALQRYRHAQALVKRVKERGLDTNLVFIREAALNYAIIQCYTNLQSEPHHVMREFHNFGEVLYDFIFEILGDDDSMSDLAEKLRNVYKDNNYVNVRYLFRILKDYFESKKAELKPHKIELIWKAAWLFTRFTGSIHDFFLRSTDLIGEGQKYYDDCKDAGLIAREAMGLLPEGYIENDPHGSLNIIRDQTVNWLDVYDAFLSLEIEHILGNDSSDQKGDPRATLKTRSKQILDAKRNGEEVASFNLEPALEVKAEACFDDLVSNRTDYLNAMHIFYEIIGEARDSNNKRIEILTQIFIARAALRFGKLADANRTRGEIKKLRGNSDVRSNPENHIYDKWLTVIDADIKLLESEATGKINDQKIRVKDGCHVIGLGIEELDTSEQLKRYEEIEAIFDTYKIDAKGKKPKLSFKALDARIYFILGKAAFEKVKIFGENYKRAKLRGTTFKEGAAMLKAFEDTQKYLCEAHNVLKSMGYQGSRLFHMIEAKYQEMDDYNDDLLNDFKDKESQHKKADMNEIADDYRIQKWTDMVYQLLRNQDLSNAKDYNAVITNALDKVLQKEIRIISRTIIAEEKDEGRLVFTGNYSPEEVQYLEESIHNYKSGKQRTYLYHTETGKVLQVVPVHDAHDRYLILEIDFKLSDSSMDLVKEIVEGVKYLMNIRENKSKLDELDDGSDEYNIKRKEVLVETYKLFEYLFRRHAPTLGHSQEFGAMLREVARLINEKFGFEIDLDIAEFAGLLHDIGKLYLNPKLILDIPRRFQDFEREEAEKHATEGLEVLRGLLGFKHFKILIAMVAVHHVKYGLEEGYPVAAPGYQIINLLKKIALQLDLSDEEAEELNEELEEQYCWLARAMNPVDQILAVRSIDRNYRVQGPMPLKVLNGYLNSKAGIDFQPEFIQFLISLFNEGHLVKFVAHTPQEQEAIKNFEGPDDIYTYEQCYQFVLENHDKLEEGMGIQFDELLGILLNGTFSGLTLTSERLGRGICDLYIENCGNKEQGIATYHNHKEHFFNEFEIWLSHRMTP